MTYCFAVTQMTNPFPQHVTLPSFSQPLYITMPLLFFKKKKRKTKIINKSRNNVCFLFVFLASQEDSLATGLFLQHQVSIIYIWNSLRIYHCSDCSTNKLRKDFMKQSEHYHLILKGRCISKWWFRVFSPPNFHVSSIRHAVTVAPIALYQPFPKLVKLIRQIFRLLKAVYNF